MSVEIIEFIAVLNISHPELAAVALSMAHGICLGIIKLVSLQSLWDGKAGISGGEQLVQLGEVVQSLELGSRETAIFFLAGGIAPFWGFYLR